MVRIYTGGRILRSVLRRVRIYIEIPRWSALVLRDQTIKMMGVLEICIRSGQIAIALNGVHRLPSSHDVMGQVWPSDATWQSKTPTSDSPEAYYPSRLPPRIFNRRQEERANVLKRKYVIFFTFLRTAFRR